MMSNDSRPESTSPKSGWLIVLIIAGLFLWGSLIAWGVIRNQVDFDYRKPLFIFGVVAIFLAVWLVLLWRKKK